MPILVPGGYDTVALGRLLLGSVHQDITETLGATLEAVGAGVVAGEGRPKAFNLSLPIYGNPGSTSPTPQAIGQRLRRQFRSMLQNADLRGDGLWFQTTWDTELNSWLLVGGGDLNYDEGGVTLADFEASLTDCFQIGKPDTHRAARRAYLKTRKVGGTAAFLDTLERWPVSAGGFSGMTPKAITVLPVSVSDVTGYGGAAVTTISRTTAQGNLSLVADRTHGEVLSFEQAIADRQKGDVVIYDRRGQAGGTDPAVDPQTLGWEEVFGPDYPLSADVPVLDNGIVRVQYVAAQKAFMLERYSGSAWVEDGRVSAWTSPTSTTLGRLDTLVKASVVAYTWDYALLRVTMCKSGDALDRADIYISLRRGWQGPRFEIYAERYPGQSGKAGVALRIAPLDTGTQTIARSDTSWTSSGTFTGFRDDFVAVENWLKLTGPSISMAAAVLREGVRLYGRDDTTSFASGTHKSAELEAQFGTALAGYLSMHTAISAANTSNAGLTGSQDLGKAALYVARSIPALVAR